MRFPEGVSISRFEPKPGWTYQLTKDASGKITAVTWSASGEGLSATEFGEFAMQGKVADNAIELSWKAYQTYKDGSVVEWTGAAGSDKPASVTKVQPRPAGAAADSHGHTGASDAHPQPDGSGLTWQSWTSIAALVISLVALVLALRRSAAKSRP